MKVDVLALKSEVPAFGSDSMDNPSGLAYNSYQCGFRLAGLTGQGSIPWISAGFAALLLIGFCRDIGSLLLNVSYQEKEVHMKTAQKTFMCLVFGSLNQVWAIGASVLSVPPSA